MAPVTALCRAPKAPSCISAQTFFLPRVTFKQQPDFLFFFLIVT